MNKQKQILSLLLTVILMMTVCFPVFAADITDKGATTVEHTVAATWTATVPAYVEPAEQGQQTAEYAVTLEQAVIPDGKQLTASVAYSGAMTEQNGVELPYKLYDESGNELQSGAQILTEAAGAPDESVSVSFGAALTAKAKYAGVYTDTATFTFDVAEKTYTAEEIDADPLLYGIGKTKPEYVVAKVSEDMTTVTVFKNGDDSDGLIKDFASWGSPFITYKATLKNVLIQDGVTSIGENLFQLTQLWGGKITISSSVVEIADSAFDSCLPAAFYVADENPSYCSQDNALYTKDKTVLIRYPSEQRGDYSIPDGTVSVLSEAFYCSKATSISIPDSVTSIAEDAFVQAYFENIYVSESNGYYKDIDGVLFSKDGTSLLKYPGGRKEAYSIPEGVQKVLKDAFYLSGITEVTVPGSVAQIEEMAFANCIYLTKATICEGTQAIRKNAFFSCSKLKEIYLPASISEIESSAIPKLTGRRIYGPSGSYAEAWATENGYTFVAQ